MPSNRPTGLANREEHGHLLGAPYLVAFVPERSRIGQFKVDRHKLDSALRNDTSEDEPGRSPTRATRWPHFLQTGILRPDPFRYFGPFRHFRG